MPRKARVEFAGAVYHLLDRGDRQEAIFHDETDRLSFLRTLGEVCARTGWRVHAFVLMTNHYHLLVETPEANLVAGMRWFQTTWTMRFNRRHGLAGHLFQGRYKAVLVDPEERGYFVTLSDYIHLNPVRAGLVKLEERLFDYQWSSYRWYAARAGRAAWFEAGLVLAELGLEDTAPGRRAYAQRMRQRAVEESQPERREANERLRRGWCLGGASFRERMLQQLEAVGERLSRARVDGVVRRSHALDQAEQLLRRGLEHFGLTSEALGTLRKNDHRKRAIARLIRGRTTIDNGWIARQLKLGHASAVSRCLQGAGNDKAEAGLREALGM